MYNLNAPSLVYNSRYCIARTAIAQQNLFDAGHFTCILVYLQVLMVLLFYNTNDACLMEHMAE